MADTDDHHSNTERRTSTTLLRYARHDRHGRLGLPILRALHHPHRYRHKPSELAQSLAIVFSTARKFCFMTILWVWFPFLWSFKRNGKDFRTALDHMQEIKLGSTSEPEAKARGVAERGPDGNETIPRRDLLRALGACHPLAWDSADLGKERSNHLKGIYTTTATTTTHSAKQPSPPRVKYN
jgi:hypothetical protein